MVKISFASIFFLLATLSSLSFTLPIEPQAIIKLDADLNTLSVDVAQLATFIVSVDNGLDVVDEAKAFLQVQFVVQTDLVTCNSDTSSILSFSADEAENILKIVDGIVPTVGAALSGLVEKRNYFETWIVPGPIIYSVLKALEANTIKLANSLIDRAPSGFVDEATSIRDRLQVEFNVAIKAYSSLLP